jgi:hypothetical protein
MSLKTKYIQIPNALNRSSILQIFCKMADFLSEPVSHVRLVVNPAKNAADSQAGIPTLGLDIQRITGFRMNHNADPTPRMSI